MTDLKFHLLEMFYNASPLSSLSRTEVLNSHIGHVIETRAAIEDLITQGYIKADSCSDSLKITPLGRIAYESEKEKREQNAKQEAEKRADQLAMISYSEVQRKKQFRHDFIVATFSAILASSFTLLIEHLPQLLDAISSLFK